VDFRTSALRTTSLPAAEAVPLERDEEKCARCSARIPL